MLSVFESQLFLNDVDQYLASPERYPKITTPKSASFLMSPGTTNNSSHVANEPSDQGFSFKENDILSLSHSNSNQSKFINELDLSFTNNEEEIKPIESIEQTKPELTQDALLNLINFLDQAAKMEIQNCDLYTPMEFQCIMPLEISQDEENSGLKLTFTNERPEKLEKQLAKMRLLRGHQENFAEHFCKYKDFLKRSNESWKIMQKHEDDEETQEKEKCEVTELSQRSKKCKKTKRSEKKKEESSKRGSKKDSCNIIFLSKNVD